MMVISLDFIFFRLEIFLELSLEVVKLWLTHRSLFFKNNWHSFNCIVSILLNINELQNYISSFWEVSHMNQLLLPIQNLIFHYHTHMCIHIQRHVHIHIHTQTRPYLYVYNLKIISRSMIHYIIMKNTIHAKVKE